MDFWATHSWLFIVAMMFFPRLTMLFATSFGHNLWYYWPMWFFFPRATCAVIAVHLYGDTNPMLVGLTIIWAILGEIGEKLKAHNKCCER